MKQIKINLPQHNPALEPNMNIADIVIRYGLMMAIAITAVFLKVHILFFLCTFILWEGMMGWCVVHHMLGIDHHNSKKNKSC